MPLPRLYCGRPLDELRDELGDVRFIGGSSGSGKSTVARRLAAKHGFRVYETEPVSAYVDRTTPGDAPLLHAFLSMDMDERWLNRSPAVMRDTFHGFRGELFPFIIEDLRALPKSPPILAEGFTLLPRLVSQILSAPHQAVWLVPTPDFRRAAFDARGSTYDIPSKTSDPERALENLLERARLFGEDVERDAMALRLPVIRVDRGLSVDGLVKLVSEALHLS